MLVIYGHTVSWQTVKDKICLVHGYAEEGSGGQGHAKEGRGHQGHAEVGSGWEGQR